MAETPQDRAAPVAAELRHTLKRPKKVTVMPEQRATETRRAASLPWALVASVALVATLGACGSEGTPPMGASPSAGSPTTSSPSESSSQLAPSQPTPPAASTSEVTASDTSAPDTSPGDDPATTADPGAATTSPPKGENVIPPSDSASPSKGPLIGPNLPTGPVPTSVSERPQVQAAIADVAAREGVDPSEVSVAGYTTLTWNDGSLGCPEPGRMYTQALVPGELLVLQIEERLFSYHAATGKTFAYCAKPQIPSTRDPDS